MFPVEKAGRNTEDPDRQMNHTKMVPLIIKGANRCTERKVFFKYSNRHVPAKTHCF